VRHGLPLSSDTVQNNREGGVTLAGHQPSQKKKPNLVTSEEKAHTDEGKKKEGCVSPLKCSPGRKRELGQKNSEVSLQQKRRSNSLKKPVSARTSCPATLLLSERCGKNREQWHEQDRGAAGATRENGLTVREGNYRTLTFCGIKNVYGAGRSCGNKRGAYSFHLQRKSYRRGSQPSLGTKKCSPQDEGIRSFPG